MTINKMYFRLLVIFILCASYWILRRVKSITSPCLITPRNFAILKISDTRNEARISEKWSHQKLIFNDEGKFHIVTNIVLTTHLYYSRSLLHNGSTIPKSIQLKERQMKIEEALQRNLNNERIAAVHVLYDHPEIHIYLLHLQIENSSKLVLHLTKSDPTLAMSLKYIQTYLMNKTVILMNQDIYLGGGWDKISISTLRSNKLMYTLTRHLPRQSCPRTASCDEKAEYIGSHDVFVFYVATNFTTEMLMGLDFGQNGAGMENVLMWYFEKLMGYRLLNPCKIVYAYHNHCVPVRFAHYKRYNQNKSSLAPFSSRLF